MKREKEEETADFGEIANFSRGKRRACGRMRAVEVV